MRATLSRSRRPSVNDILDHSDLKEELVEVDTWTGPTLTKTNDSSSSSWQRSSDRSNRTFLSTFSLPAAAWRPVQSSSRNPQPVPPPLPQQQQSRTTAHYQTVSLSLAQRQQPRNQPRRSTIDSTHHYNHRRETSLPELPRRYSEIDTTVSSLPVHNYRIPRPTVKKTGAVKRKPVPTLAVEEDVDTVQDPLWDGYHFGDEPRYPSDRRRTTSSSKSDRREEERIEDKVRNMSLEEVWGGATGLGFLVKETSRTASMRTTSASSAGDLQEDKNWLERRRSSSWNRLGRSDSYSTDDYSLYSTVPVLDAMPYPSLSPESSIARTTSTRTSSPPPLKTSKSSSSISSYRPFALLRRQPNRPLPAHTSIIPSLAADDAPPSKKGEEELMDAWMDIIVGKEEEPAKPEKPALVFQSRRPQHQQRQNVAPPSRPRPDSIASLANSLPPLVYASDSRRSSVVSLPSVEWSRPTFEVRDDSDTSENWHDARERISSWGSEESHHAPSLGYLRPVIELPSPLCRDSPSPAIVTPIRFSPVVDRLKSTFDPQYSVDQTLPPPRRFDSLPQSTINLPTKRNHSRSTSFDSASLLSTSTTMDPSKLPPRPPKSARRSSKTSIDYGHGSSQQRRLPVPVV